jgi:CheY-like chemotaxis protein
VPGEVNPDEASGEERERDTRALTRGVTMLPNFDTETGRVVPVPARLSHASPMFSRASGTFDRGMRFAFRPPTTAMSTLLLVSGGTGSEQPSKADRSGTHRVPTLKGALERAGYEVVHVEDAAGALAHLGAAPPDLIVLAGAVPDMELLDLCAAVRREPAAEKVPFVLVADASARTGRSASRAGADLVFPATVGPAEIADRLRRLF